MTRLSRRLIGITGMSDIVQRRIPVLTLDSKVPGPVVWMTACIHGDEVGGTAIVHDVMESLRHGALQAGTVHAFPLINSMGFENVSRYINADREDLNRCFPGSATGTMGEQIARRLFDSIVKTKPDIVIDLHNDWIHSVPYLLIDPPECFATKALHFRTLRLARETGLLTVEDDSSPRASTTMSGAAVAAGIASLTLEAGGACGVVEEGVAAGKAAVLAILAQLGMTAAMHRDRLPNSTEKRLLTYTSHPLCNSNGLVRFSVAPGDSVAAGTEVARVYSAFGSCEEKLRARSPGYVLGLADHARVVPGSPVVAIAELPDADH